MLCILCLQIVAAVTRDTQWICHRRDWSWGLALYDTETNHKQDEQVENGANGTSMDQEAPMMENVVHDTPHNQIRLVSENAANETEANEVPIYQNIAGI